MTLCLNVIEYNVMIIINNFNLNPNPNPNHVDGDRWCEVITGGVRLGLGLGLGLGQGQGQGQG